jgi:hypothetical protein
MPAGLKPMSLVLLSLTASLPLSAQAAGACPSDSLAAVIGLGSCTAGDVLLDFTHQHGSFPIYYPGPWAGVDALAPAAGAIGFTPIADADHPGFTQTGFGAGPASGWIVELAYFDVRAGAGRSLTGDSIALGGVNVTQGPDAAIVLADIGRNVVYLNNRGDTLLSSATTYDQPVPSAYEKGYILDFRASAASPAVASFDSVTYRFDESTSVSAVPEPSIAMLLALGLGGIGVFGKARRHSAATGRRAG